MKLHGRSACVFALIFAATHAPTFADEAGNLLDKLGERKGICVIVGSGDAQLPVKLAAGSEFTLFVSVATEDQAAAARQAADDAGLLGTRIYVSIADRGKIGLGANLADAAIVIEPAEVSVALRAGDRPRPATWRSRSAARWFDRHKCAAARRG